MIKKITLSDKNTKIKESVSVEINNINSDSRYILGKLLETPVIVKGWKEGDIIGIQSKKCDP